MTIELRYTVKAGNRVSSARLIDHVTALAKIWQGTGAHTGLWATETGSLDEYILAVRFKDLASYGKSLQAVNDNKDYIRWKAIQSESAEFQLVFATTLREIALPS